MHKKGAANHAFFTHPVYSAGAEGFQEQLFYSLKGTQPGKFKSPNRQRLRCRFPTVPSKPLSDQLYGKFWMSSFQDLGVFRSQ